MRTASTMPRCPLRPNRTSSFAESPRRGHRATLFDCGDNAALTFGLQFVERRNRGLARWIRTHAHAPERALAGLQRLGICGVSGLLQALCERVRLAVVGEGGELNRVAFARR